MTGGAHTSPDIELARGGVSRAWKEIVEAPILLAWCSHVPEFCVMRFHQSQCRTPRTFEGYTDRAEGLVEHIPGVTLGALVVAKRLGVMK